jgi:hypothetical protein
MTKMFGIDYFVVGVPTIIAAVIILVFIQNKVQTWLENEKLSQSHNVNGYYFSVAGTLYAVLLGLVVVNATDKFNKMVAAVDEEALSLVKVYSLLEQFPVARAELQHLIIDYKNEVVANEFKSLGDGKISLLAKSQALHLLHSINRIEPQNANQLATYPHLLSEISQFWDARSLRTATSNYGEPNIEWVTLLIGGLITISFSIFFVEDRFIGSVMTAITSTMVLMNLYLILMFGNPFSGDLTVDSKPFDLIEEQEIAEQPTYPVKN